MNKNWLITLLIMVSCSSLAHVEEKVIKSKTLKIDLTKYCYHNGVEFSKGSVLNQHGTLKVCERDNDNVLFWKAVAN